MHLLALPDDLLLLIFSKLDVSSLVALYQTNHRFQALAVSLLPSLLHHSGLHRAVTVPNLRLDANLSHEQLFGRLRRAAVVDEHWKHLDCVRHHVSRWQRRTLPVLRLHRYNKALLTASGPDLAVHRFDKRGQLLRPLPPQLKPPRAARLGQSATDDITAIVPVRDDSPDVMVAHLSGRLHRVTVDCSKQVSIRSVARFQGQAGIDPGVQHTPVQSVSVDSGGRLMASVCRPRQANTASTLAIHQLQSPWIDPAVLPLAYRPWSVCISSDTSSPWVATGQTAKDSLVLHRIRPDGISRGLVIGDRERDDMRATAPYSLITPSGSSSVLSPQHLIAGCYDGNTRIYDCRIPEEASKPVQMLSDPWSEDPNYSVALGGAAGQHVAVGSARHGAIRIFDIRAGQGSTVFATRENSPVYSLDVEHSRLYAALESHIVMLDFSSPLKHHSAVDRPRFYKHGAQLHLRHCGQSDAEAAEELRASRWRHDRA